VECGDWKIPFDTIEKAIAYRTKQMFIPATVLHLITKDGSYQFGFNPWARPLEHLDLDVTELSVRIKYSAFSIVVRISLVIYLVHLWLR